MSFIVGMQLTTRCNLRCAHCYVGGAGEDVSLATVAVVADGALALGCGELHFTGGEPSLHPRFAEIVDMLWERGLRFAMVSNAWNFEAFHAELLRRPKALAHVSFSLDGAEADVHDANRGAGSYERVLAAARLCGRTRIPFGLRMTLSRANVTQLGGVACLADDLGAAELVLVPLMPTRRTAKRGWLLSPGDLSAAVAAARSLRARTRARMVLAAGFFAADPLRPCPAFAGQSIFVTSRGTVSICCQLADYADGDGADDVVADLREISLAEAAGRARDRMAGLAREKGRRAADHSLGFLDHHPCWYCLKRFGKVNWMGSFPDTCWGMDFLKAQNASAAHAPSNGHELACAHQPPGF